MSFAKKISKNIGKSINKNLRGKCSHKLLDYPKQSATDALKNTSKWVIQKTAKETGDLTNNEFSDKITKVSRTSPQNSSETGINETEKIGLDTEAPKNICISPERRHPIIDNERII